MPKDLMKDLLETIGAGSFATHIREQIIADQRAIAEHYSSMDGMQYPDNLLGAMEQLLSTRKYHAIENNIECWRNWIDDTARIQKMLERTLVLIEAFLIFYRAENGSIDE